MTALGLAVAIPAVLGYTGLVRGNRVILARLDVFAHDLFAFLTMGQPVVTDNNVRARRAVHRAAGQPFAHCRRTMMAFGTFNRGGTPGPMSEINMIPLIDVMLVLLVIFMLTAPLLTHAIKIDLPQATAAVQQPKADKIKISIDGEGALFWNGEPIDLATIKTRFDTAALQSPSPERRRRAGAGARYQILADLMASAGKAGLGKIAFVTEPDRP